jgi:VIT1/CCC1 family predicted Fe2+/Mn2+ transporter
MLNHSIKTGVCFGLTSGVITTLGLMVGLNSGTHSRLAVLGGILTIAVADAFSDALGIHIAEESESTHTHWEIWQSTIATFLSKLLFALTFAVPVILLDLTAAVMVSVVYGLSVLGLLSFYLAREQGDNPLRVIAEHLAIAVVVIGATHAVGTWINSMNGGSP